MEVLDLIEESVKDESLVTLEATVVTGFEFLAFEEVREKCEPTKIVKSKGRVFFNVPFEKYDDVKSLRCVDNLYLVCAALTKLQLSSDKEKDLEMVKDLVERVGWDSCMGVWTKLVNFKGMIFEDGSSETAIGEGIENTEEEEPKILVVTEEIDSIKLSEEDGKESDAKYSETAKEESKGDENMSKEKDENDTQAEENEEKAISNKKEGNNKPNAYKKGDKGNNRYKKELRGSKDMQGVEGQMVKYRVTCHRTGEHSFTSMDAARDFGGSLQDKFNWTVDLSHYDLEVVLNISDDCAYICSGLTRGSLHRRNITHFSHTTLRATLCYGLLRLAGPKPGDLVLDPLCGGGSISIEGQMAFPHTFQLCGDRDTKALDRCSSNVGGLSKGSRPDIVSWDCTRLPLRKASVDVAVTDLPFGKRSGKKVDNRMLYKKVLQELGRVVRPSSGRVTLLTSDRNSLSQALYTTSSFWRTVRTYCVNQGGMSAYVFLLNRTSKLF